MATETKKTEFIADFGQIITILGYYLKTSTNKSFGQFLFKGVIYYNNDGKFFIGKDAIVSSATLDLKDIKNVGKLESFLKLVKQLKDKESFKNTDNNNFLYSYIVKNVESRIIAIKGKMKKPDDTTNKESKQPKTPSESKVRKETKNDTIEIADEDVVTRKPKRNKGFFLKKVITPALIAGGLVGAAVAALWFTPISFLSFMSVLKTGSLITNIIGGACFGFASAILATPAYFKLKKWLTNRHYKKLYGAKSNNLKKLEEGQEIEKLPIVTLLNKIKNSNLGIKRIRNRWHGVYDFKAFLDKQIAGIVDKESDTAKKYIKLQKYIQTAIDEDIIKNYNAKKEGKAKFNENLDIHVRRSIKDKHNFKTDINFTARCKDMIKKAFSNPNVEVNFEKMKEESTDVTELEKFVTPTATADKTRLDFSTYSPEKSTSTTKTEASTLTIPELMPIEKWEEDAKEAKAKESLIQKKNNQKSKSFKVDIKVTENNYMLEFITNNSQTLENYGFSEDFLEKLKSGILSQRRNNVKFKSTPTCKRVFPTDEEQELLDKIYTICNEVMISHKEIVQACENVGLSPKFNTI